MNSLGIGVYAEAESRPAEVWDRFGFLDLQLCMMCPAYATYARIHDHYALIGLRPDFGDDASQVNDNKNPADEALRWADIIRTHLAKVPDGTYDFTTGINEAWPNYPDPNIKRQKLQWRADFELALCRIVQKQIGIAYAWGAIPVGNLEANEVAIFKDVFREAWATNYHGYTKPNSKIIENELDDPYWLHRPYMIWKSELDKLGIPLKLFLGECGCYYKPPMTGITPTELALLNCHINETVSKAAARYNFTYYGSCGFGVYLDGQMFQDGWDIRNEANIFNTYPTVDGERYTPKPLVFDRLIPPIQTIPTGYNLNGKLRVAIIPSNQDRNTVLFSSNEKVQIEVFATKLKNVLLRYTKVEVTQFNGTAESKDTYNLEGLIKQTDSAYNYLSAAPVGTLTCAVNLHSDSGSSSHVGFYYCDGAASVSGRLAKAIGEEVSRQFGTSTILSGDYSEYIFSTHMRGKHAPVLIELGSHQNLHDVEVLANKGDDIAEAIANTLLDFFTVSKDIIVPVTTFPFAIGQGFKEYLHAHPDAGLPRHDEQSDIYGNRYVWLTATAKYPHGAELQWRKYLNKVQLVSWE